jgi:hypothetical protein
MSSIYTTVTRFLGTSGLFFSSFINQHLKVQWPEKSYCICMALDAFTRVLGGNRGADNKEIWKQISNQTGLLTEPNKKFIDIFLERAEDDDTLIVDILNKYSGSGSSSGFKYLRHSWAKTMVDKWFLDNGTRLAEVLDATGVYPNEAPHILKGEFETLHIWPKGHEYINAWYADNIKCLCGRTLTWKTGWRVPRGSWVNPKDAGYCDGCLQAFNKLALENSETIYSDLYEDQNYNVFGVRYEKTKEVAISDLDGYFTSLLPYNYLKTASSYSEIIEQYCFQVVLDCSSILAANDEKIIQLLLFGGLTSSHNDPQGEYLALRQQYNSKLGKLLGADTLSSVLSPCIYNYLHTEDRDYLSKIKESLKKTILALLELKHSEKASK